jgi:hypothetical protein
VFSANLNDHFNAWLKHSWFLVHYMGINIICKSCFNEMYCFRRVSKDGKIFNIHSFKKCHSGVNMETHFLRIRNSPLFYHVVNAFKKQSIHM